MDDMRLTCWIQTHWWSDTQQFHQSYSVGCVKVETVAYAASGLPILAHAPHEFDIFQVTMGGGTQQRIDVMTSVDCGMVEGLASCPRPCKVVRPNIPGMTLSAAAHVAYCIKMARLL